MANEIEGQAPGDRIRMVEGGDIVVPNRIIERQWELRKRRFTTSRNRILECSDVRHGRVAVGTPDATTNEDAGSLSSIWAARDPERLTLESRVIQTYADNKVVLERTPLGTTDQARSDADSFELWVNTVIENQVPRRAIWGKLVEDGEFALVAHPNTASWWYLPEPYDMLTDEEWQELDEAEREDYTEYEPPKADDESEDDEKPKTTRRRFKREYWRDRRGRSPDDHLYTRTNRAPSFVRDERRTGEAYEQARREHLCEKFPVDIRLISALDCIPYLVEGRGRDRYECRGLLMRKLYELDDLVEVEGYRWHEMEDTPIPVGYDAENTYGANGQIYLYEAWIYVRNPETGEADPCIVYSVGGVETWKSDDADQESVVVNLRQEYGLTKLPIYYGGGPHTESDDPGMRWYGLLWPILQTIINREGLKTSYLYHVNRYAFGKLGIVPDPSLPASAYMAGDQLRDFNTDGDLVTLPGPVVPLVQPPVLQGVLDLYSLFDVDIERNMPSRSAAGQGGANPSGHALTMTKSFVLAAASDSMDGFADAVRWLGETVTEICDRLREKYDGRRVPVWVQEEIPVGEGDGDRSKLTALELNERWLKGNYRLRAEYQKIGNLAEIEQLASLYERKLATFEDVQKARGKRSPDTEHVKIAADAFRSSPEGLLMTLARMYERRGDLKRARMLELKVQQALTAAGFPVDALDDAVAPPTAEGGGQPALLTPSPAPPGNTGPTQLNNPAASARAGIISGAMGTAARQADANAMIAAGGPTPSGGP